jgi:hypothetical protein
VSTLAQRIASDANIPFEVRKVFANAGEPEGFSRNWVLMWRETVARAVMDALGFTGQAEPDKHNVIMVEAQRWFRYSADKQEVFDLADLPLEITRDAVIQNFPLTRPSPRITRDTKQRK